MSHYKKKKQKLKIFHSNKKKVKNLKCFLPIGKRKELKMFPSNKKKLKTKKKHLFQ